MARLVNRNRVPNVGTPGGTPGGTPDAHYSHSPASSSPSSLRSPTHVGSSRSGVIRTAIVTNSNVPTHNTAMNTVYARGYHASMLFLKTDQSAYPENYFINLDLDKDTTSMYSDLSFDDTCSLASSENSAIVPLVIILEDSIVPNSPAVENGNSSGNYLLQSPGLERPSRTVVNELNGSLQRVSLSLSESGSSLDPSTTQASIQTRVFAHRSWTMQRIMEMACVKLVLPLSGFELFTEAGVELKKNFPVETYNFEPNTTLRLVPRQHDTLSADNNGSVRSISSNETQELKETETESHNFPTKLKKGSIYLTCVMFRNPGKALTLSSGVFPAFEIADSCTEEQLESFSIRSVDFQWASKVAQDWAPDKKSDDTDEYCFNAKALETRAQIIPEQKSNFSNTFKRGFYTAAKRCREVLGLDTLGYLYPVPIRLTPEVTIIIAVQFLKKSSETIERDWKNVLLLRQTPVASFHSMYIETPIAFTYANFYRRARKRLSPGLYLALFSVQNSIESLDIMVSKQFPNLPPVYQISTDGAVLPFQHQQFLDLLKGKNNIYDTFSNAVVEGLIQLESFTGVPMSIKDLYAEPVALHGGVTLLIVAKALGSMQSQQTIPRVKAPAKTASSMLASMFSSSSSSSPQNSSISGLNPSSLSRQQTPAAASLAATSSHTDTIPFQLFEILHYNTYTRDAYTTHKQSLSSFAKAMLDPSLSRQDRAMLSTKINEEKKAWNANSWVNSVLTEVRERAIKAATA